MQLGKTNTWIAGAMLLGAFSLGGCATKKFVNQEVSRVETQATTTQNQVTAQEGRLGQHEAKIGELDKTSREALERATAAGKLAEGKFVYQMVVADDSMKFRNGASSLSPEAEARLAELATRLKGENRNVYLEIQGHTDATGSPTGNERLGEQRAEAVRRFLNKQGVALNRMGTISYGESEPMANNRTRDGRSQNRRVVVVVLS